MDARVFELNSQIEMSHWWFVARRQIISGLIRSLLPPDLRTTVVDVGCGTGGNISDLANDYRCVGIDPSRDAIDWAQQRFPGVRFLQGYAPVDLDEEAKNADLFMLNDVLEHVSDDFEVFSSILSVARRGAYFVLTVPADMSLWSPHDTRHGHYRRYTMERFEKVWEDLPVTCLMTSHFNTRLYPIVKVLRTLNRRRQVTSGDHGTDLKVPAGWLNQSLSRVFAGEAKRLSQLLHGERRRPYGRGVSLVAVLRRDPGKIVPRRRPAELADDPGLIKAA